MAKNPLPFKPGARMAPARPDIILTFNVKSQTKLLDFLFSAMPDRKRTTVKDYLKHRQVMVGQNVTTQFDTELFPGNTVSVNTSREFQTFSHPRIKIVYEDDDILVVNKGYGLLSVGTDSIKEGTAYSILREYLKRKDQRNKIFIVHRLDQHTSGLMMFAKNTQAKETMQHNWNNMVLERCYNAIIRGRMEPAEGEIRSYLTENSAHEVYSTQNPEEGQLAVTRYRTVGHLHPSGTEPCHRPQKPDTRTSQGFRPSYCRRPPLWLRRIANTPPRPPCAHAALRPSRHTARHELQLSAPGFFLKTRLRNTGLTQSRRTHSCLASCESRR